ncbi:MAG TPA: hypothetical protein VNY05_29195 [Candidatus Acidoferrales bacterium]|jgi:hypothetical protein|nr:hypothetical protein [Candidatus Acidoferrales bacterium]
MLLDLFRPRPRLALLPKMLLDIISAILPAVTPWRRCEKMLLDQPGSASIRAFLTSNGWFLIHWLATNKYPAREWIT